MYHFQLAADQPPADGKTVDGPKLKERLPEVFYPLRRGYLVNTLYIVALRRFEAELISGISIPIPALTYTQVKRDLQELIEKK